jgi:hypothetical protein
MFRDPLTRLPTTASRGRFVRRCSHGSPEPTASLYSADAMETLSEAVSDLQSRKIGDLSGGLPAAKQHVNQLPPAEFAILANWDFVASNSRLLRTSVDYEEEIWLPLGAAATGKLVPADSAPSSNSSVLIRYSDAPWAVVARAGVVNSEPLNHSAGELLLFILWCIRDMPDVTALPPFRRDKRLYPMSTDWGWSSDYIWELTRHWPSVRRAINRQGETLQR